MMATFLNSENTDNKLIVKACVAQKLKLPHSTAED